MGKWTQVGVVAEASAGERPRASRCATLGEQQKRHLLATLPADYARPAHPHSLACSAARSPRPGLASCGSRWERRGGQAAASPMCAGRRQGRGVSTSQSPLPHRVGARVRSRVCPFSSLKSPSLTSPPLPSPFLPSCSAQSANVSEKSLSMVWWEAGGQLQAKEVKKLTCERLNNLPKATELIHGRARCQPKQSGSGAHVLKQPAMSHDLCVQKILARLHYNYALKIKFGKCR
ncbi:uncharacterized protein LOC117795941 [Ailuropoda melanoleuca]|uniref:uncharacterized protein LOC117795941 n=1 Tax=Ailuropoda melanoleuca TaxID=9646 RepID=UPI00149441CF|nr:uncharacterized protein LOC117795941 [Ailuropoda melanoleuca]